jgi:hypothetical protein
MIDTEYFQTRKWNLKLSVKFLIHFATLNDKDLLSYLFNRISYEEKRKIGHIFAEQIIFPVHIDMVHTAVNE